MGGVAGPALAAAVNTIEAIVTDGACHSAGAQAQILVPHDQRR